MVKKPDSDCSELISFFLPHQCVLCHGLTTRRWPLCPVCEQKLGRIGDPVCQRCGAPLISTDVTCMRCRQVEYSFDFARTLYMFAGDARRVILAYKSQSRTSLAGFFAAKLAASLEQYSEPLVLVPVPPRPGKIYTSGWDQVAIICRLLAKRYGFTVWSGLRRSRGGQQQKKLSATQRQLNMHGRFYTRKLPPETCLLLIIDDIFTTGATVSACARVLKAAGAGRVGVHVIAMD